MDTTKKIAQEKRQYCDSGILRFCDSGSLVWAIVTLGFWANVTLGAWIIVTLGVGLVTLEFGLLCALWELGFRGTLEVFVWNMVVENKRLITQISQKTP